MLGDYVFVSELAKEAGVKPSYFYALKKHRDNQEFLKKVGSHIFVKKDLLPEKYKKVVEESCTDLSNLLPASYVTKIFDLSKDYMAVIKHNKTNKLKIKKINNTNFVIIDDELMDMITNMTPFRIRDKADEQYAEKIFKFGYTKIGFY